MIKFTFILLLFLYTNLLASPILINDSFESTSTINNQSVYFDQNKTVSLDDILENKTQEQNITNVKSGHLAYWVKFSIKNISQNQAMLMISNERAGTDIIDIYIFDKNSLVQSYQLGDMREQALKPFLSTKSIFPLVIEPEQEYVIVTKMQNFAALDLYFNIKSLKNFSYSNNVSIAIWGMLGGAALALILYNSVIYFNLREKYVLLYVLYAVFLLMYLYSISGMFYMLNLGINLMAITISTWILPLLALTFLVMFVSLFFNIKIMSKRLNNLLNALNVVNMLFLALFIYGIFDKRVYQLTPLYSLFVIIVMFTLVYTAIWAYRLKLHGAQYFLVAQAGYALFVMVFTLSTSGFIGHIDYMPYISSFVLVLDIVLISIAVSVKILIIKNQYEQNELLLIEESKFAAIGKGLGNVTHQLKTPLAEISSNLLYIEALHNVDKKPTNEELMSSVANINDIVEYMQYTIKEICNFYQSGSNKCFIELKTELGLAIKINNDNLILGNVDVQILCEDNIQIYSYKNVIANIISILIENSLFAFSLNKTKQPHISISVFDIGNQTVASYLDNAGGIGKHSVETIFEIGFTTKQNKGSGLGLALAKKLVEEKLGGKINALSYNNGMEFRILMPVLKQ